MTQRVARLALPFTDTDLTNQRSVRVRNVATGINFTVSIDLPSTSGVDDRYYNGGDLGTGNTATWAGFPDESLVMAFAYEISVNINGFALTVVEGTLSGRYQLTRNDGLSWQILWTDGATTMPPEWLGFENSDISSTVGGIITAPHQSDRLWVAPRPTWQRVERAKLTSHAMTWSGRVSRRKLSQIRNHWDLRFSAIPGARVYISDGEIQTLVDAVPEMALNDPNVALESLWDWIASRGPAQFWPDENSLGTSYYLNPRTPEMLEQVKGVIQAERSNSPPVYDLFLPMIENV